jgi:flagellar biosynthetic protein FliO
MWWEYIKAVMMIVLIIAAAYYVTKYVAVKAGGARSASAGVKIRGSASLGRERQIVLAEIGGTVYVLGVTAQHIELLDKMAGDQLEDLPEETLSGRPAVSGFQKEFLERLKGTYRGSHL